MNKLVRLSVSAFICSASTCAFVQCSNKATKTSLSGRTAVEKRQWLETVDPPNRSSAYQSGYLKGCKDAYEGIIGALIGVPENFHDQRFDWQQGYQAGQSVGVSKRFARPSQFGEKQK
jgi:hypothetical protein